MKLIYTIAALLLFAGLLPSCGSSPALYSWGNYEQTAYAVAQNPTPERLRALGLVYEKLITQPEGLRKTPPPGLCAEYGYLLAKQGDTERGVKLLEKEAELYPESAVFVRRLIKQLKK